MRLPMVALVSLLDIAAAAVVAYFNEGNEWPTFFLLIALFWLLPPVLGLWGLIKYWVAYKLFLKKRLVRFYVAKLHEYQFPSTSAHYDDGDYLTATLEDAKVPLNTKLKAAAFVGEFGAYRSSNPYTTGLANAYAFQEAMSGYRAKVDYGQGWTDDELDRMEFFTDKIN